MAGCTAVKRPQGKATVTADSRQGVSAVDPGFAIKAPNQSLDPHFAIGTPDQSADAGFAVNPPIVRGDEINEIPNQVMEPTLTSVTSPAAQEARQP